ncbi:HAD family hydrolase [Bacillus horti]|uniref:FMN phosphatase YigB (HAD superfamily) n=1 Tax=Caldalkalibacillus horti TaxID=77523 RepID=A0ABT9W0B2_9BACI|nr:HAD family hydrolase [Bacillus horti]MDQ0166305.1 FMN phosphatase YigB (HAD superfamily) [Bacillus horti]
MDKKWITFDLDGTLMQNPFGAYIFPELQEIIGSKVERDWNVVEALVKEHEQRLKAGRYVAAYDWDEIVQTVLGHEGLKMDIDVEQMVLKHSVLPKVYMLEESIPQVLQELKNRGYSLAVATNGFMKYQAPVLQAIGILEYFDKVITPEIAGAGKPDVAMLKELDDETIAAHVGDRIDHDITLANAMNVHSILIATALPVELEQLTPQERAQHELSLGLCKKKLEKETGVVLEELDHSQRPQTIIKSIEELLLIL